MQQRKWQWLLALVFSSYGLLYGPTASANNNIKILDRGHLLTEQDRQAITQAAQQAPFGVVVIDANGGFRNKAAFDQAVDRMATADQVVVAIDPADDLGHINARSSTGISDSLIQQASQAAAGPFKQHDYVGSIVAAINTLAQGAPPTPVPPAGAMNSAGRSPVPMMGDTAPAPSLFSGLGKWIIIFVVIAVLVSVARRLFGGGGAPAGAYGQGYGPTMNQPGNMGPAPGYGPNYNQGYGPGYGPGYAPGGGRGGLGGGLMAGGLGALGGGLLGYELGKNAGENENLNNQQQGNVGGFNPSNDPMVDQSGGGDFGGGGGDFGGGGGDFGGGGGDFGGGGGDFGGGGGDV